MTDICAHKGRVRTAPNDGDNTDDRARVKAEVQAFERGEVTQDVPGDWCEEGTKSRHLRHIRKKSWHL